MLSIARIASEPEPGGILNFLTIKKTAIFYQTKKNGKKKNGKYYTRKKKRQTKKQYKLKYEKKRPKKKRQI